MKLEIRDCEMFVVTTMQGNEELVYVELLQIECYYSIELISIRFLKTWQEITIRLEERLI
jgi:hypothetical protein